VGIAGPPAAGKSTLAACLVKAINAVSTIPSAVNVPMDGFHRHSSELRKQGTLSIKGAPRTFDVDKLKEFLCSLKISFSPCRGPLYSREIHDVVEDAYSIDFEPIVIIEGNYLLLDAPGWKGISELLDWRLYLSVEESVSVQRLFERHIAGGRSREEAEQKITLTDMPNFRLIQGTAKFADRILSPIDLTP